MKRYTLATVLLCCAMVSPQLLASPNHSGFCPHGSPLLLNQEEETTPPEPDTPPDEPEPDCD